MKNFWPQRGGRAARLGIALALVWLEPLGPRSAAAREPPPSPAEVAGATHLVSGSAVSLAALLHERGWRQRSSHCMGFSLCEPQGVREQVQVYGRRQGPGGVEQVAYIWPLSQPMLQLQTWGVCVSDADDASNDVNTNLCADARADFYDDLVGGLALLRRRPGSSLPWAELRHGLGELDAYLQAAAEGKSDLQAALSGAVAGKAEAAESLAEVGTMLPQASEAAGLCDVSMPAAVPLQRQLLDTVIWRDNADDKLIALTFDACSTFTHGKYNRRVIDLLRQLEVPATLFIGGHWAEMHPAELRELGALPQFELGNHTYSHPHMTQLSPSRQREELLWTQYLVYKLTGQLPRFYRPPYGEINDQTIYEAAKLGLYTIEYDLPAGDADIHVSAQRLIRWVVGRASSGSIVIMHMNHPESKTAEILPEIVRSLRARGFTLAKVSDLVAHMEQRTGKSTRPAAPLAEDQDPEPTAPMGP